MNITRPIPAISVLLHTASAFLLTFFTLGALSAQPMPSRVTFLKGSRFTGKSSESTMILDTNWRYHRGDVTGFESPAFDDSSWDTVRAEQRDDSTLLHNGYYSRTDCYRLHLYVDSTAAAIPFGIRFRSVGASEIYLDGRRVKKYGTIAPGGKSVFMVTQFNPFILNFGTPGPHVIAVRFANFSTSSLLRDREYDATGFGFEINEANTVVATVYYSMIENVTITAILTTIFLVLFFIHLLLYLFYRAERSNLFFSIFCLSLGLFLWLLYLLQHSESPDTIEVYTYLIMYVALSTMLIAFSGLNNELFGGKRIRFRIVTALSVLAFFAGITLHQGKWLYIPAGFFVLVEGMVLPVVAMIKKRRGAKIVGSGVLFFTLFFFLTLSWMIINQGLSFESDNIWGLVFLILMALAILSIPLSMSIYLSWNFASVNKELKKSFQQLQELSEKTLEHEQEKKRILERQNEMLEEQVAQRTAEIETQRDQLAQEKQKSDDLLLNILPEEVAEELKQKGSTEARVYDEVTVIFTDFVNFTKAGEEMPAKELVNELNICFRAFDEIIARHGIEKIKTIGDAYLAVSGLPLPHADHAVRAVTAAKEIVDFMTARRAIANHRSFEIRVGIHSGSVVAGIVGLKKFAYDIWGDTVNTAARIEQNSEPGKINISETVYEQVKDRFTCRHRGCISAKNKGELSMYFVEAEL